MERVKATDAAMEENLMTLLQRHRKSRGLTQTALARKLKLKTPSTISKWESGEAEPSPSLLPKLARIFGIDPMELTRVIAPENGRRELASTAK